MTSPDLKSIATEFLKLAATGNARLITSRAG
jgi:hypothetical protein